MSIVLVFPVLRSWEALVCSFGAGLSTLCPVSEQCLLNGKYFQVLWGQEATLPGFREGFTHKACSGQCCYPEAWATYVPET